jgi:hypothetical protein
MSEPLAACHAAVERWMPEILPFTEDADEELALEANALLGAFDNPPALVEEQLRRIAGAGENARAGTACVVLAHLAHKDALEQACRLARALDRLTSVLGACAAVLADAATLSDTVLDVLTQPIGNLGEETTPLTGTVSALVGRCLARLLGGRRHAQALQALARLRDDPDAWRSRAKVPDLTGTIAFSSTGLNDGGRICDPESTFWRTWPRWRVRLSVRLGMGSSG